MSGVLNSPATRAQRRRFGPWLVLGLGTLVLMAILSGYLTAARPDGRMDPAATGADGAHALVSLLRANGVEVLVAGSVADVEHRASPDSLVLVAETERIADDELLQRLARVPGDRLLVQPSARARKVLAPGISSQRRDAVRRQPDCDLREAERAGVVDFAATQTYRAVDDRPVRSCYAGALIRYRGDARIVTVVGSSSFMTNAGLTIEGNAALAMNLTGARNRLVWYAPQRIEGEKTATATVTDLVPQSVGWMLWQLGLALALTAWWRARRMGPLVAERLPVVVRASETVEGLGRLYRSRRARDRAARALRIAMLQRLAPRLGLNAAAPPPVLVTVIAQRTGTQPEMLWHLLFGPPPGSDAELLHLAHSLDNIERQVIRP